MMKSELPMCDPKPNPKRWADFTWGLLGWFLIAGILAFPSGGFMIFAVVAVRSTNEFNFLFLQPFFINAIVLGALFWKRRWMGWGMLSAILLNGLLNILALLYLVPSLDLELEKLPFNLLGLLGVMNFPWWIIALWVVWFKPF